MCIKINQLALNYRSLYANHFDSILQSLLHIKKVQDGYRWISRCMTLICSQKDSKHLYPCIISMNVQDQKIFNISCFYFTWFICVIYTLFHALIYGKIILSKGFFLGGWWRSVFVVWYRWGLHSIYGNFIICFI